MFLLSKRSLRQGMSILPSALMNLSFGFVFGWISPSIEYYKSDEAPFPVSKEELSWIASAYFITETALAGVNGLFTGRVGRKPMLAFSAFLQALGWFIKIFAHSPTMVIVSRALLGAAAGTYDVIWCMYLGEVTNPSERGIYGSLLFSLFLGGIMIEFFLSIWLPHVYLAIVPFVISTLTFVMKFFIKETPFYLIKKGKLDAAKRNLTWLQGVENSDQVEDEFNEIKKYVEEDAARNYGLMHVLQNLSKYKVTIAGVLIFAFAQPSGHVAIISFQTMLLDLFDESKPGADLTLIYGTLQFIFINFSPFVVEKIGRKKPMLFGFGVTTILHIVLAYLFYMGEYRSNSIPYLSYIICCLFNVYGILFALTILPQVYILKCELFPQELKSIANCSATMTNAFADFVVVKLFSWIWFTFGLYANFILYAVICFLSVVYVQLLIPETKGKTLIEIQEKIDMKYQKKISRVSQS